VFQVERPHARPRRQPGRRVEVGVALVAADDQRRVDVRADQLLIAPHAAAVRRLERSQPPVEQGAIDSAAQRIEIVLDVQQAAAVGACVQNDVYRVLSSARHTL